jgi:hypothetical protein
VGGGDSTLSRLRMTLRGGGGERGGQHVPLIAG